MCGIIGQLSKSNIQAQAFLEQLNSISHRGPDDKGVWSDESNGISLGHVRLSIVDTSESGHQPMHSKSDRYVMVYNGEIYNHNELRNELESVKNFKWSGHSDTETLLTAIELWGIKKTLEKCVGMFAIAIWDKKEDILTLTRDRIGEKPLYYGFVDDSFVFASELKAIKKNPNFNLSIDREALKLYFQYNYVPTPYSIYKGIKKLEPGSILTLKKETDEVQIETYWSLTEKARASKSKEINISDNEAVASLDGLLHEIIKNQMLADVPLGAFLSGGIDSSAVVSIMQSLSNKPVKTFTMGFEQKDFNEAEDAKLVARHLGTEHHEMYVSSLDAKNVIPLLPEIYDEPFSDASQIPTFLVSKLAKEHVTVSLSGDAGDELFCGYNRYHLTDNLWNKFNKLPMFMRRSLSSGLTAFSPNFWDKLAAVSMLEKKYPNLGHKIYKGARVLSAQSLSELYTKTVSNWESTDSLVKDTIESGSQELNLLTELSEIENMMLWDMQSYLPDDILVKLDRASMAVSLESRVPFLDHRLIEFAWTVPQTLKYRNGKGKWLLRQVLYKYVPEKLIERPKKGFSLPVATWLRGDLKDWAQSLIEKRRLKLEGYLNVEIIHKKWEEHLSGKYDWSVQLWSVLMFQSWLESQ